jgi:hypothetical protein
LRRATSKIVFQQPPGLKVPLIWLNVVGLVSITTLGEKLVKIGAMVVSHGRCVTFQMAEVAMTLGCLRRCSGID